MHPSSCKPGSNSFTRSGSPIYSTQSSISRSIMDWEGIAVVRMRWQHSNHSYAPRYIQKHTKIQHLTRKFQFNQEFRLLFRYLSFTPILNYTPKVYIRCKSPIIVMRSKLCYTMSWLAQSKVLDKRIWSIPIMMLYHNFFMPYLPSFLSFKFVGIFGSINDWLGPVKTSFNWEYTGWDLECLSGLLSNDL